MRLIFIRHGHPNYDDDCLTPLGLEQAKKAALRLQDEGIDEIYSSPCGRAYETARMTADLLGKSIKVLDFTKELTWGSANGDEIYAGGHPWLTAEYAVSRGHNLMDESWTKEEPFSKNILFQCAEQLVAETDKWLESLGYRRENSNYRVIEEKSDKTIALFSHAGSSSAMLSRILNLPLLYVCETFSPNFTAITSISFPCEHNLLVSPKIEYANDARHIKKTEQNPVKSKQQGEQTYQM